MAAGTIVAVTGASNVRRGLAEVVTGVLETRPDVRHLLLAGGNGRSYGMPSSFLGRVLPGILECRLWSVLEQLTREGGEVELVLADIGNDLVYGAGAERLASWIEQCLDRAPGRASACLVLPPTSALRRLGPIRFRLLRALFFPGRPASLEELRAELECLERRLRELAGRARLRLVEPPVEWYGVDPIHLRGRCRASAWRAILGAGGEGEHAGGARPDWRMRRRLLGARPERRRLFGVAVARAQPCRRLPNGAELWLF